MRAFLIVIPCVAVTPVLSAQPPAGSEQRRPLTAEHQAASAAPREAEMKATRPTDAFDSVWMVTVDAIHEAMAAAK